MVTEGTQSGAVTQDELPSGQTNLGNDPSCANAADSNGADGPAPSHGGSEDAAGIENPVTMAPSTQATATSQSQLRAGQFVEVLGLTSEKGQQLNGQKGIITEWAEAKGRFEVRLGSDQHAYLKPENLRKVDFGLEQVAAAASAKGSETKLLRSSSARSGSRSSSSSSSSSRSRSRDRSELQTGDRVVIAGLQSKGGQELNGKEGIVLGFSDESGDRREVRLVEDPSCVVSLRPENMKAFGQSNTAMQTTLSHDAEERAEGEATQARGATSTASATQPSTHASDVPTPAPAATPSPAPMSLSSLLGLGRVERGPVSIEPEQWQSVWTRSTAGVSKTPASAISDDQMEFLKTVQEQEEKKQQDDEQRRRRLAVELAEAGVVDEAMLQMAEDHERQLEEQRELQTRFRAPKTQRRSSSSSRSSKSDSSTSSRTRRKRPRSSSGHPPDNNCAKPGADSAETFRPPPESGAGQAVEPSNASPRG